jgi:hypothetical protein
MAWVSEGTPGITRARELDKGAAAGFASKAARGNENISHVPVAPEVAAKFSVAGAWCHVMYIQPPVNMQPAHRR